MTTTESHPDARPAGSCFWRHDWTRWSVVKVKPIDGQRPYDANRRSCLRCGLTEQKVIVG